MADEATELASDTPSNDEGLPTTPPADDNSGWAALRDAAIAKAQAAVDAGDDDGDGASDDPADALTADRPAPKAKPAPKPAGKPRAANGKFAKPAAADELLPDDAAAKPAAEDTTDEELGEPELPRPRDRIERLLAKRGKLESQSAFERERAELTRQIEELRAKVDSAGTPYHELQQLAQAGELDTMLQKLGYEKGFATAQQKWLEKRGAVKAEDPRLRELAAEVESMKREKAEQAERAEQQRQYQAQLEAQQEELNEVISAAAESPYREIRELAALPDVKNAFGTLLLSSLNTPEYADRPPVFHYQVARNAYRTLYQQLHSVFGPKGQPNGTKSPAPTKERVSPARAAQHALAPEQSGEETAKPTNLSQSGSAEARGGGGNRRYKSEREEWEAHTRAVRPARA